jgi:hypothetical protein
MSPSPPHLTTLTLAVWPARVYSEYDFVGDHTLTVPSFDDDAHRGDSALLIMELTHGQICSGPFMVSGQEMCYSQMDGLPR